MATAAVIGGTTLIGGYLSYKGAKEAGEARVSGIQQAGQTQRDMLERMLQVQAPWRQAGQAALQEQMSMLGIAPPQRRPGFFRGRSEVTGDVVEPYDLSKLSQTPGYQFAVQEGTKGLERSQAARGLSASGRGLKDMERFRQGLASQQFNQRLAQLGALSGMGGSAAGQAGQGIMQAGANIGTLQQQAGAARGQQIMDQTNVMTNLLNQAGGFAALGGGGGGLSPGMPGVVSPGSYGPYTSPGYVPPGGSF